MRVAFLHHKADIALPGRSPPPPPPRPPSAHLKENQPHPCVWHPCLSSCTRLLVVLMVVSAALVLGDPTYWPALVGTLP